MKIVLSKPIPPNGRKPTGAECLQFNKQNTRVTQSGAWRVGWTEEASGEVTHSITYFNRRACEGFSYDFIATDPEPKPAKPIKTVVPRSKSSATPSNLDEEREEPCWCW